MKFWVEELETDSERGLFIRRNVALPSHKEKFWPTSVAMMINRSGESQKIAQLFAAAPEMLEALEAAGAEFEKYEIVDPRIIKIINSALAKAKGEK